MRRRLWIAASAVGVSMACTRGTGPTPAAAVTSTTAAGPDAASASPSEQTPTCKDELGMVYIPGGAHRARDKNYFWQEVEVKPFWLDKYEVTVEQFRECVDAGACTPPYRSTSGYTDAARNALVCTWEIDDVPNLPINCVDGDHHDAFCAWQGKRSPVAYEWTWAAQGRDQKRKFPWGDAPVTCELAITDQDLEDDVRGCGLGRPWPVGSRLEDRTRDGVMDMQGNVAEKTITPFRPDRRFGDLRDAYGDSWRTAASLRYGVTSGSPSARENFSDNSGLRCAKDPGPLPPCTSAD